MTEHVEGFSREQVILLPDRLDDYVDEENPVRFIDAFVDSLDLKALGFKRVEPEETGRPPYDPSDLLKLYLYGYLNHVRSSRRLKRSPCSSSAGHEGRGLFKDAAEPYQVGAGRP